MSKRDKQIVYLAMVGGVVASIFLWLAMEATKKEYVKVNHVKTEAYRK